MCLSICFLELPVFPTVTAKVTFNFFEWRDDLADSLFEIPARYHEDPSRFPDLWLLQDISIVEIICSFRNQVVFDHEKDGDVELQVRTNGDTTGCTEVIERQRRVNTVLAVDIPLTNLGSASTEMVLMFPWPLYYIYF